MTETRKLVADQYFRAAVINLIRKNTVDNPFITITENKEKIIIGSENSSITINLTNSDIQIKGNLKIGEGALFEMIGLEQGSNGEYLHIKRDGMDKWIPIFNSLP